MKRILLLLTACVLSSSPLWAQGHPCDLSPTSLTVVVGTTVTLVVCHSEKDTNGNPTTLTAIAVYDGAVRTMPTFTRGTSSNAAGLRDYQFSYVASGPGVHTITTDAINAQGEGVKDTPFALTVTLPLTVPVAPAKHYLQ